MTITSRNTAILMLCHVLNEEVLALFEELCRDCGEAYDVVFRADNTNGVFESVVDDPRFAPFTLEELASMPYPVKARVIFTPEARARDRYHTNFNFAPGSADLPVLRWVLENPGYDYYWVVEYDVRYTGSWRQLFSAFEGNDADLLCTIVRRYQDDPDFLYWPTMRLVDGSIRPEQYVRGFFPIHRMSKRAWLEVDRQYSLGAGGHHEVVLPTLLAAAGMRIEDIGGDGEFVRPENSNRYYDEKSFAFRPIRYRPGKRPDTLWHPVKGKSPGGPTLREYLASRGP